MRLHRFFITETIGDKPEIAIRSIELANQIQRVFRLKRDDLVVIFDGSGFDYECSISGIADGSVSLRVNKSEPSRYMATRDIYLCAGMVKKDVFEWITEKATELGVTHIIPVMAERSEKKSLNEARLKKIAIEASEQSGRGDVPVIEKIMTTKEALDFCFGKVLKMPIIVFHKAGDRFKMEDPYRTAPLAIFIGPEGGWSPEEIEMFHKNNTDIYCLGNQILRSETAVIATLSQVVFNS